jgi:hypothetical protein
MELRDHELMRESAREMRAVKRFSISIELDLADALTVLSGLQLALRHPLNTGPASDGQRTIANRLEFALSKIGPATAEILRRGWEPEHDVGVP